MDTVLTVARAGQSMLAVVGFKAPSAERSIE
jgi:hypothetical protein